MSPSPISLLRCTCYDAAAFPERLPFSTFRTGTMSFLSAPRHTISKTQTSCQLLRLCRILLDSCSQVRKWKSEWAANASSKAAFSYMFLEDAAVMLHAFTPQITSELSLDPQLVMSHSINCLAQIAKCTVLSFHARMKENERETKKMLQSMFVLLACFLMCEGYVRLWSVWGWVGLCSVTARVSCLEFDSTWSKNLVKPGWSSKYPMILSSVIHSCSLHWDACAELGSGTTRGRKSEGTSTENREMKMIGADWSRDKDGISKERKNI